MAWLSGYSWEMEGEAQVNYFLNLSKTKELKTKTIKKEIMTTSEIDDILFKNSSIRYV